MLYIVVVIILSLIILFTLYSVYYVIRDNHYIIEYYEEYTFYSLCQKNFYYEEMNIDFKEYQFNFVSFLIYLCYCLDEKNFVSTLYKSLNK